MRCFLLPKNKFLKLEIDTVFIPMLYYITLYLIFSIYNSKIFIEYSMQNILQLALEFKFYTYSINCYFSYSNSHTYKDSLVSKKGKNNKIKKLIYELYVWNSNYEWCG